MAILLWIVGAVLLLALLLSGFTFFAACRRFRIRQWENPESLKNTKLNFYADLIINAKLWCEENQAQTITCTSDDGLKLSALWIPAENPRGTILLAHGYRSVRYLDFGAVLDLYHRKGLNIILPDQRAHGDSEGKYITFGVKESSDMLKWLNYHNTYFSKCPIILSGLSMGASTVMYMLDQPLPDNVAGVIVDCGFTSPAEIINVVFKKVLHFPGGIFVRIADLLARIIAGFSFYKKDSCISLKNNTLPILMVHGKADDFVPCWMTECGYEVCGGIKRILLVEDAAHGLSFIKNPDEYRVLVDEILDISLGENVCYQ